TVSPIRRHRFQRSPLLSSAESNRADAESIRQVPHTRRNHPGIAEERRSRTPRSIRRLTPAGICMRSAIARTNRESSLEYHAQSGTSCIPHSRIQKSQGVVLAVAGCFLYSSRKAEDTLIRIALIVAIEPAAIDTTIISITPVLRMHPSGR